MSARRRSNDNDSRRYYEWLDRAQADLQSARLLIASGGDLNTVVFHCHQVAEKSLKGFLLFRSRRHYDGHNITFLVRRASKLDHDFNQFLADSPPLNRFYIETRYPTDIPLNIDIETVRGVFRFSEKIYQTIASKLHNEPEAFYSPSEGTGNPSNSKN